MIVLLYDFVFGKAHLTVLWNVSSKSILRPQPCYRLGQYRILTECLSTNTSDFSSLPKITDLSRERLLMTTPPNINFENDHFIHFQHFPSNYRFQQNQVAKSSSAHTSCKCHRHRCEGGEDLRDLWASRRIRFHLRRPWLSGERLALNQTITLKCNRTGTGLEARGVSITSQ